MKADVSIFLQCLFSVLVFFCSLRLVRYLNVMFILKNICTTLPTPWKIFIRKLLIKHIKLFTTEVEVNGATLMYQRCSNTCSTVMNTVCCKKDIKLYQFYFYFWQVVASYNSNMLFFPLVVMTIFT